MGRHGFDVRPGIEETFEVVECGVFGMKGSQVLIVVALVNIDSSRELQQLLKIFPSGS